MEREKTSTNGIRGMLFDVLNEIGEHEAIKSGRFKFTCQVELESMDEAEQMHLPLIAPEVLKIVNDPNDFFNPSPSKEKISLSAQGEIKREPDKEWTVSEMKFSSKPSVRIERNITVGVES